jgi:hypothetical protein
MIGDSGLHCWGDSQRLMNAPEIIEHIVDCYRAFVIL